MPTEADIWTALGKVIHPTYGMSVIALQMVRAVRMAGDSLEVDLVMNCPGCPAGEATLAQIHQALHSLVMPATTRVIVRPLPQVWSPPWEWLID